MKIEENEKMNDGLPAIYCELCCEGKGDCECDPCLYGEHDWIVEHQSNGCGGTWDEVECRYCDSEISDDEWESLTSYDDEPVRD
jgi:hypothetical protein